MQLTFDKYTISGTAQELADYVSAYEEKQVKNRQDSVLVSNGTISVDTSGGNPSGL